MSTRPKSTSLFQYKLLKKAEHVPFDVESWYPHVKEFSFATEVIRIGVEEARAFVNYYQNRYNHKQQLTLEDLRHISSVEDRIATSLHQFQSEEKDEDFGVFVRMSSRSPKDGTPLKLQNLKDRFDGYRTKLLQEGYADDKNTSLVAWCRATSQCLKVTSSEEAMNLLLSSERVFVDLLLALDCTDSEKDEWRTNIILRKWEPQLDDSYEFRLFIHKGELTQISQYNHLCVFNHLLPQKDELQKYIVQYFESIKLQIPYPNYIVDLGIIDFNNEEARRCVVIELNPYAHSTGAGLFHWTVHKDLLENGPVDLKLRTEVLENIDAYFEAVVQRELDEIQAEEIKVPTYKHVTAYWEKQLKAKQKEEESWSCLVS